MAEKTPVRERLLKAAGELFYPDGIRATGIDAITARAGVARMSLYNNFSSKADLVNAYIQSRYEEWLALYKEHLRQATTPQERILAIFDSYLDIAIYYNAGFRGCALLNVAAELPLGDPGRELIAQRKQDIEKLLKKPLQDMRLADDTSINQTAEHLSFLLEGAMSRAGLDGNVIRLEEARKTAVSILEQC